MLEKIIGKLSLNDKQFSLFKKYCNLRLDQTIDPIEKSNAMDLIWRKAEEDLHLSNCLELVDYFIDSESDTSNIDRRVLLSEHLQGKIEAIINETNRGDILRIQKELSILEVKPAGSSASPLESSKEILMNRMKEAAADILETATDTFTEVVTETFISIAK
jgi:hypothetical protein